MKCFIRGLSLKGGAPRSLFEYVKALSIYGYESVVLSSEGDSELEKKYRKFVKEVLIRKSPAKLWDEGKHLLVYKELLWEYKYIKKNNPDLIITLGEINGAFYTRISKALGIPLIICIPGGELNTHPKAMELWDNCEVICFSRENAEAICPYYSSTHINVISNRIKINAVFDDLYEHYVINQSEINILIVSRISKEKVRSIYSLLNHLKVISCEETNINVKIAGDGSELAKINDFVGTLNNSFLRVNMLGHINDLTEEFRWAHIIAGKGRSVIEPIMMNRIGCVIGEDGKLAFCNTRTFDNLYHFNFAGRNIEIEDSEKLLINMIDSIRYGKVDIKEILETAKNVSTYYSTDYLPEKLEKVLAKLPQKSTEHRIPLLWLQYLRFICKKVKGKFK